MTTELVKINPQEFGLTEETAKNIQSQFQPMLDKMVELEDEFNQIVVMPIEDVNTAKKAKELRLRYVKIRTATADIHKNQKQFYLNGGRFVDGWKNAQLFASQSKETKLEEIEKYQENLEKERKEKLHLYRVELIREYIEDTTHLNLGDMEQDVFDAYLTAKKQAHFDRIEAEKKAIAERIEAERIEAERLEAQRLENEKLKAEREKLEAEAKKREEQIQKERKAAEEKARIEKEKSDKLLAEEKAKAEAERKRVEAENEAKLKAEREEREKLQAELKAKQEAEERLAKEKAEAERKAKAEADKLAKAPIKKQAKLWVESFVLPLAPIENPAISVITQRFEQFKKWATDQVESI